MSLNQFAKAVHQNAKEHGWWDQPRSFGEIIALCHAELSEAIEEYRNGNPDLYPKGNTTMHTVEQFPVGAKPEGTSVELADCIIRILDYCGYANIDIDGILKLKHEYNKTRPYKHGGKII